VTASSREFVIPAGHARMWRMRAGERVTILQMEGYQVGDLIAFNATDPTEFLSPSHTRRCLNAIRLQDLAPTNAGRVSDLAVRLS